MWYSSSSHLKSLTEQLNKVHTAVLAELDDKIMANRRSIIETRRSAPNFDESKEVLVWHEADGTQHKTLKVTAMMDAAGPTREYGNRSTGTQSAACMVEKQNVLPIAVKVSRMMLEETRNKVESYIYCIKNSLADKERFLAAGQ